MTIINCKKMTSLPSLEEYLQQLCVHLPFLLSILACCSGHNVNHSQHHEHYVSQFWVYPKMHPCLVINLGQGREARSRASAHAAAEAPSCTQPRLPTEDPASAAASLSGSRSPPPGLFTPWGPARRRRRRCRLLSSTLAPLPIRPPPPPPPQPRLSGASSSHQTLRNRDSSRAGRKLPRNS